MADNIELEVRRPGGRTVTVDVVRRERQGPLEGDDGREAIANERRHHFGGRQLASKDALLDFLGDISRPADDGGIVGGWIYENDVSSATRRWQDLIAETCKMPSWS